MYYSETVRISFPAILTIIMVYLIGLSPVYISYKLGNRVLLAISAVCGLFSIWVFPPAVSILIVCLQIPASVRIRIDKKVFPVFWVLLFTMFTFLPAAGAFGFNMKGYYLLSLEGLNVFTLLFYLTMIVGLITAVMLKGRALYMMQMIVMVFSLGCYMVLAWILFGFDYIVKSGPYVTLILLVLGTAAMLYLTYSICAEMGTSGSFTKEEMIAGLKSAGETIKDTTGKVRKTVSRVIEEGAAGTNEKCANCGADIKASQAFCPQCGKQIIREPKMIRRYRCSKCGTYVKNKNNFCGLCGGEVVEVEEEMK